MTTMRMLFLRMTLLLCCCCNENVVEDVDFVNEDVVNNENVVVVMKMLVENVDVVIIRLR